MGLPKGRTNNPAGKPSGTKSTKTKQWEELGEKIVGESAERFMNALEGLNDEDFMKHYLLILEYFKPKQQRTEIQGEVKGDINISRKKWVK